MPQLVALVVPASASQSVQDASHRLIEVYPASQYKYLQPIHSEWLPVSSDRYQSDDALCCSMGKMIDKKTLNPELIQTYPGTPVGTS